MYYEKSKVYSDGNHFIAIPGGAFPSRKGIQKKSNDESSQTVAKQRFDEAYRNSLSKPKKERKAVILSALKDDFEKPDELSAFVNANLERVKTNRIKRIVRLIRKLNLQEWNYFCTFTYDEKIHTEESFRRKLANTLKHFVARNGWKYIGVWERSPEKQRLHFHGIFYTPKMIGKIEAVEDYSTKNHRRQKTYQNSHFLKHFGRNDFRPIAGPIGPSQAVRYITKYIEKTGERLVFGGDLPTYFVSDILESDVVCPIGIDNRKALLFDDFHCISNGEYKGQVSPETIAQMPKCN